MQRAHSRPFLVELSEAKGPKHRRFHLNVGEQFFSVRVAKHWPRLPGETEKSPWIFWTQPWKTGSTWSCMSRRLDKVIVRDPFQLQQFSVNSTVL